ncbi:MAG: hypothetical protein ABUK01_19025 [Leptospirales bacterium]
MKKNELTENDFKKLELAVKLLATILTLISIFVGIWLFNHEQSINDINEFKRNMWHTRMNIYMKTSATASRIANSTEKKELLKKYINDFYALYWGDMIIVQDEKVGIAMKNYHLEIQDFLIGHSEVDRLKIRAYELSEAFKTSAKESWEVIK